MAADSQALCHHFCDPVGSVATLPNQNSHELCFHDPDSRAQPKRDKKDLVVESQLLMFTRHLRLKLPSDDLQ